MLTFFRRIRKGLLDKGQARKYVLYAFGEIALVVIGILIALQINNWNETLKSKQIEQQLLIGLKDELIANKVQLGEVIRQHEWAHNCCRTLLGLFNQEGSIREDRKIDSLIVEMI